MSWTNSNVDATLRERYLAAGRVLLPVPAGSKKTLEPGWSDPQRKLFAVPADANVAWRLDGLADIDLDCPEAIEVAALLLPPTPARSGRPSAHSPSHWFYAVSEGLAYEKFEDPAGGTLLEVRTGSGHYTVVPPSVLPAARGFPSERSMWAASHAEPVAIDGAQLRRRAALLATACLLARGLGRHGFGHDARLDVAGFLLRHKVTELEAIAIGAAVSRPTDNTEIDDVTTVVESTARRLESEKKISGGASLIKRMGDRGKERVAAIARWLGAESREHLFPEGIPPLTESGDAERFAELNAEGVRYDWRRGRWLLFDGQGWRPQTDGEMERLTLIAARTRQTEAIALGNDDARRAALKWSIAGEARARRMNLLDLARSVRPLADNGEHWDEDDFLLGTPNAVVDLRTGEGRPGRLDDRITMRTRARWDPDAKCPLWDMTVGEVFGWDDELISFFDRFIGYSITGDCREEVLAVCYGDGANGKGTLMNTLGWVLGDYADDLPFSAFELNTRSGIPNDIAKIVGKRFVTSSETGEAIRLNEARIKALTGRDPITARFLHKEFFTFQPVAKFWLATNHKPDVQDDSAGFWRRLRLIPFEQSFIGRENKELKHQLRNEMPGILARAVRGVKLWMEHGLEQPQKVVAATGKWRHESDVLTPFLDECCVRKAEAKTKTGSMYAAYARWHSRGGSREKSLTLKAFIAKMQKQFDVEDKVGHRLFLGIALLDTQHGEEQVEM